MPLFSRRIPFDRKKLLEQAEAATKKRRRRRAVVLYRQLLAAEPRNPALHARIAPLLARTGRPFEAWESFRIAAEAPEISDDPRRAEKHFEHATRALPKCLEGWRALARARLRCQQPDEALKALLEGRRAFRRRRSADRAIALLRDAREIAPWDSDIVLDLAHLLMKRRQPAEALFLLEALEQKDRGQNLRDLRRLVFRIDPTIGNAWRWLRATSKAHSGPGPIGNRRRRA
jgi:tetratricopeptide (TPR) repeat protein